MAGTVNKVIIVGNVGKEPEIRTAQDGSKFASFVVATSDVWKDKLTGERKEKTEWHRVVVFNQQLAEIVEKYVSKGSKVYLEGQLQTRKWQDNSGQERYTTEVVITRFKGEIALLDRKSSEQTRSDDDFITEKSNSSNISDSIDSIDDEIPF